MIETSKRDTIKSHEAYYNHGTLSWLSKAISGRANRNKYDVTVNGNLTADKLFDSHGGRICPSGMSFEWNSNTIPIGYLLEDGAAVSRTTYADLFAAIGTAFGSGDGSTTFNLPNSKGKVSVGYDSSQTEFNALAKSSGSKYLQSHTHGITRLRNDIAGSTLGLLYSQYAYLTDENTTSAGTGNSENLQPYIVKQKIIKY